MPSDLPFLIHLFIHSKFLGRRKWHPTPVFLPGKSHGQRNLVGYSPWRCEESDTTERLHFHFSLSCIGEGNGNPLQCSCLENSGDSGAWWAAIYGVAQSWTWLKWLSSSSKISWMFNLCELGIVLEVLPFWREVRRNENTNVSYVSDYQRGTFPFLEWRDL